MPHLVVSGDLLFWQFSFLLMGGSGVFRARSLFVQNADFND
jgi:hypothetical protein